MTQKIKITSEKGDMDFDSDLLLVTNCIQGKETKTFSVAATSSSVEIVDMMANAVYSSAKAFLEIVKNTPVEEIDFCKIVQGFVNQLEIASMDAANMNMGDKESVH